MKWNGLRSYKPAVDDLWHPLSPAHGLPRISASENIFIFIQDQGAPPSPSPINNINLYSIIQAVSY